MPPVCAHSLDATVAFLAVPDCLTHCQVRVCAQNPVLWACELVHPKVYSAAALLMGLLRGVALWGDGLCGGRAPFRPAKCRP